MAWNLTGRFIEVCSCKLMCSCWLGPAEADQGWCSGAILLDIQQGNSDGVNFSGIKAALVADWPKDFMSGNGTARWLIDEAASDDQRRELEPILTGTKGGPWEALGSTITKWLPALATSIQIDWGDKPSAKVGSYGVVTLEPVRDEAGQQTQMLGAAAMGAFQLDHLDLARSDGSKFSTPDMRQWESGGEEEISTFKWSD